AQHIRVTVRIAAGDLLPVDREPRGRRHPDTETSKMNAVHRIAAGSSSTQPDELHRPRDLVRARTAAVMVVTLRTRHGVRPWTDLRPAAHEPELPCPDVVPAQRIEVRERAPECRRALVERRRPAALLLRARHRHIGTYGNGGAERKPDRGDPAVWRRGPARHRSVSESSSNESASLC